MYKYLLMFINL